MAAAAILLFLAMWLPWGIALRRNAKRTVAGDC
jgi:hypothetical protein